MKAKPDETLEEIWVIRRQIAQEFGFDPRQQVAHYQRKQKQLGARIYQPEVTVGVAGHTSAVMHDDGLGETAAGQCAAPTSYRGSRVSKAKRPK